jgi:hypothetical protein
MKPPAELAQMLRRYDPDVQSAALALRTAVLAEIGPCHEAIYSIKKWISLMYSTTEKRMKDNICLIVVYRDHVSLLFPRGVDLKDPRGLLEGTGKAMRHVKMRSAVDVDRPGVRALIAQAKKRPDLGSPVRPLRQVTTTVKATRAAVTFAQSARPRLF